MIGALPTSLEVGGRQYSIRSDFRVVLNIFEALNDPEFADRDKVYIILKSLYIEDIPENHLKEALEMASWFMDGGNMPKSKPLPGRKTFDWKHDEAIIFPAINKTAGYEVRGAAYLHWWTFIGYFNEIGDGLYSTVMHIRCKRASGKKLDKGEQEFYKNNKDLIDVKEQKSIYELEAEKADEDFLNTLTGR
nr:MAG TPA: hypothetical protein [Caudoviricetes sp.]